MTEAKELNITKKKRPLKTESVHAKLTPAQRKALEMMASEDEVSLSEFVRITLLEKIETRGRKNK